MSFSAGDSCHPSPRNHPCVYFARQTNGVRQRPSSFPMIVSPLPAERSGWSRRERPDFSLVSTLRVCDDRKRISYLNGSDDRLSSTRIDLLSSNRPLRRKPVWLPSMSSDRRLESYADCEAARAFFRADSIDRPSRSTASTNSSPALYDDRTIGPLAQYRKPNSSSATRRHVSNLSG